MVAIAHPCSRGGHCFYFERVNRKWTFTSTQSVIRSSWASAVSAAVLSHHQFTPYGAAAHRSTGTSSTMTPRFKPAIWEPQDCANATPPARTRTLGSEYCSDERNWTPTEANSTAPKRVPLGHSTPCESAHGRNMSTSGKEANSAHYANYVGPYRLEKTLGKGQTG